MSTAEGMQGPPTDEDHPRGRRLRDVGPGLIVTAGLAGGFWWAIAYFGPKALNPLISAMMAGMGR